MGDAIRGARGSEERGPRERWAVSLASLIATKRISVLVGGTSLAALFLLRLCPLSHPVLIPLRLVPAFSLFLFLPGFILLNWLLPKLTHSCLEAVPLAVGVSLAFWAPLFLLVMLLAVSPGVLVYGTLLALSALFATYLLFGSRVDERDIRVAPAFRDSWIIWLGIAFTAALMIYKGGFLGSDGPRFHLATIRRIVDGTRLSLEYVSGAKFRPSSYAFPLWHIVQAVISLLCDVEPAHVWYYGPALLVPISVIGFYGLTRTLFDSKTMASLSAPVYIVSTLYYHYRLSYSGQPFLPWTMVNWPSGLNLLILLPVALTMLVSYLKRRQSRPLVLGGAALALGLAMGAIHLSQLFFMLTWLGLFTIGYPILAGWDGKVVVRSVAVLLAFGLLFLGAFGAVEAWLSPGYDLSFAQTVRTDNEVEASHYAESYGFSWSPIGLFPVYPVVSALILAPLLLTLGLKAMPVAMVMVFVGLISAPLIYLEPRVLSVAKALIPNLSRMHYQIPFVAAVLVNTFAVGLLLTRLERWVEQVAAPALRRIGSWARWLGGLSICAFVVLAILLMARCESLQNHVRIERVDVSARYFFAYVGAAAVLAVVLRLIRRKRSRGLGMPSGWTPELSHPARMLALAVVCSILAAVPALLSFKRIAGAPLLSGDMNEEVGRFFGSAWVQQWWDPGLITFLREYTEEDAVIWSEVRPRQIIPVYVNRRCKEVNWAQIDGIAELRETSPTYILLKQPQAYSGDMGRLMYLSSAFRTDVGLFSKVYESDRITLVRMNPAVLDLTEAQLDRVLSANAFFVREEWDRAITGYEAAVSLDPDDPLARLGLGRAHVGLGEYEEGVSQLERAVALRPDDTWLHFHLGQAHSDRAKADGASGANSLRAAADAYARSLASNCANVSAADELLKTCQELGDWCQQTSLLSEVTFDPLIGRLEEMAEATPEDAETLLPLAYWYRVDGRSTDAAAAYQGAIEQYPAEAHAGLAELNEDQGRWDEAAHHYESAAEAAEGFERGELLWKAGQVRESLGHPEAALVDYLASAAATVDSGLTRRSYRRAARVYLAHDNAEAARCLVRGVVLNDPENAGTWLLVRDVYPLVIEWYHQRDDGDNSRQVAFELLAVAPRHETALRALTYYDFIEHFDLARVSGPEGHPASQVIDFALPDGSGQRRVISMFPQNEVSYAVDLPSAPLTLHFSFGPMPAQTGAGGCGCRFEIYLKGEGAARDSLYSECVSDGGSGRGWQERQINLANYVGRRVTITFLVSPGRCGGAECEAGWAAPRLIWTPREKEDGWGFSEEEQAGASALRDTPSGFATLYPLD